MKALNGFLWNEVVSRILLLLLGVMIGVAGVIVPGRVVDILKKGL